MTGNFWGFFSVYCIVLFSVCLMLLTSLPLTIMWDVEKFPTDPKEGPKVTPPSLLSWFFLLKRNVMSR